MKKFLFLVLVHCIIYSSEQSINISPELDRSVLMVSLGGPYQEGQELLKLRKYPEQLLKKIALNRFQSEISFLTDFIMELKKAVLFKKDIDQKQIKQDIDYYRQRLILLQESLPKFINNQPYRLCDGFDTHLVNGHSIDETIHGKIFPESKKLYDVIFFQTNEQLTDIAQLDPYAFEKKTVPSLVPCSCKGSRIKYPEDFKKQVSDNNGVVCPITRENFDKKIIPIILNTTDCNACDLLKDILSAKE